MNVSYLAFFDESQECDLKVLMSTQRAKDYQQQADDIVGTNARNASRYIVSDLPDKTGDFDRAALGHDYLKNYDCQVIEL